jgi:hypothetical protein
MFHNSQQLEQVGDSTREAKQWEGWGTALKPAHEPMVLARKPLIGTVAANVLTYGTGGLNIDGARVGRVTEMIQLREVELRKMEPKKPKVVAMVHFKRLGKQNTGGRWPANVIHDGSDEVVALFPDKAGGGHWSKTKVTG